MPMMKRIWRLRDSNAQPIFIFAAIWRSGSTLLQRLLCSDPSLILWGEPYTDTDLLPRLARGAKALLQENGRLSLTYPMRK